MRTIPFEHNGTTYHLLLNGAALFDLYDWFGPEGSVVDRIEENTREAFEATCKYLEILSTQGELLRRYQGFDAGPVPTAGMFCVTLLPMDIHRAKTALHSAIRYGFLQEEAATKKEVDLGLLELEKKTGSGSPAPSTLTAQPNFLA